MAIYRKFDAALRLQPDIAIICECAEPTRLAAFAGMNGIGSDPVWIGHNAHKGLAVDYGGGPAGQLVKIGRPPDVDDSALIAKQSEIPLSTVAGVQHPRRCSEFGSPSSASGNLAHKAMRWLVETVGNLHGQTARRRKLGEEPRKQGSVVRYPLQRSIGQNHVESPRAAPRRDIIDLEADGGEPLQCRLDHFGRAVQAHNRGVRELRFGEVPSNCRGRIRCRRRGPPSCWGSGRPDL